MVRLLIDRSTGHQMWKESIVYSPLAESVVPYFVPTRLHTCINTAACGKPICLQFDVHLLQRKNQVYLHAQGTRNGSHENAANYILRFSTLLCSGFCKKR
ncbi:hypothetical protein Y032_0099g3193 [Ancylostoma ceylanicum]|uniref:Uncharacterized protein n=1 Tax=Ancylostoma ceylanicum TaxID=53326 RepID=A0A016TI32_9BILA|nr:hypothetical protein Y032_0099g3193 [Ancylostoma ceylanicum]